jgi:hypothetical protein
MIRCTIDYRGKITTATHTSHACYVLCVMCWVPCVACCDVCVLFCCGEHQSVCRSSGYISRLVSHRDGDGNGRGGDTGVIGVRVGIVGERVLLRVKLRGVATVLCRNGQILHP